MKVRGGQVRSHVQAFVDACSEATGADNFGTYNGHDPSIDLALDIFHAVGDDDLADAICAFAIEHLDRYGVDYIISRKRIYNPEIVTRWRDMADRGGATQNHLDHVHVSFEPTASAKPAPAKPARPKEDALFSKSPVHTVHLVASHSGLLLTSSGEHHGAGVVQRRADGSLNQRWEVWGHDDHTVSLVNRAGGLALDRPDYSTEAGTFLQVARTEHNAAQRWSLDEFKPPLGRLWAPGTNRCLDVHMRSTDDGAGVQLWYGLAEADDPRHQFFVLAPTV